MRLTTFCHGTEVFHTVDATKMITLKLKGKHCAWALVAVGIMLLAAVVLYPVWTSWYWQYKLGRLIKVEMQYPHCDDQSKCLCIIVFDGAGRLSDLLIEGTELRTEYAPDSKVLRAHGRGCIRYRNNRIELTSDSVSVNGLKLPMSRPSSFRVFVSRDGSLASLGLM